ncbi:MAG: hypothetical protein ACREPL_14240 [Rhodanobacteraceae bacterium]
MTASPYAKARRSARWRAGQGIARSADISEPNRDNCRSDRRRQRHRHTPVRVIDANVRQRQPGGGF